MAAIYKLLCDPTRVQIVLILLQQHEVHVQKLCEHLHLPQPAVSHHLALLRAGKLVEMRRQGKCNYYSIPLEKFEQTSQLVLSGIPIPEREEWLVKWRAARSETEPA